ncbi:hypothetical protein FGO68_gene7352 [Halteria grandinella]|uniref:Uncharacterized protein n=1 Tax=Halteria grandinella TaxID=5974 RepID=A0A8J8NKH6_HALGN|nr:hypothetical protein FGO68_gene7352 [Halteria grandinella]
MEQKQVVTEISEIELINTFTIRKKDYFHSEAAMLKEQWRKSYAMTQNQTQQSEISTKNPALEQSSCVETDVETQTKSHFNSKKRKLRDISGFDPEQDVRASHEIKKKKFTMCDIQEDGTVNEAMVEIVGQSSTGQSSQATIDLERRRTDILALLNQIPQEIYDFDDSYRQDKVVNQALRIITYGHHSMYRVIPYREEIYIVDIADCRLFRFGNLESHKPAKMKCALCEGKKCLNTLSLRRIPPFNYIPEGPSTGCRLHPADLTPEMLSSLQKFSAFIKAKKLEAAVAKIAKREEIRKSKENSQEEQSFAAGIKELAIKLMEISVILEKLDLSNIFNASK